ncbi:DNA methyltransferase [Cerasicoccus frondis]|uniref:DNA methyltransferase n=1 Tax=Cerasicoccus frondis TaxID=490090 RepID=UPI002852B282|nr:DNA methyltransferase [Cerasicoccus frondis]
MIGFIDTPRRLRSKKQQFNRTIILGDCVDKLQEMGAQSVHLTITDPPYVVNYQSRDGRQILGDTATNWIYPAFNEIYRVLVPNSLCISFYGWNQIDEFMIAWKKAGFRPVGHIVWKKAYVSNARYLSYTHEQAYLLAKGRPLLPKHPLHDVQAWQYSGNKLHPNEKSPKILEPLIRSFSKVGDVVLDPFCGSASTAIAALRNRRQFIGIEKDSRYHEIAVNRLNRFSRSIS